MGMPCEVNSIVKLDEGQFPEILAVNAVHKAVKNGYRIFAIEVPLQLVNANWLACGEVVITKLTWQNQQTELEFRVLKIYAKPLSLK
jgi:hypothetical protein